MKRVPPVRDTWVFRVKATNKEDAWEKANRGHEDAEQLHSSAGTRKSIKLEKIINENK